MKKLFIVIGAVFSLLANAQQPSIIPMPAKMQITGGNFELSSKTKIVATSKEEKIIANFFNDYLKQYYDLRLNIASNTSNNCITLSVSPIVLNTTATNSEKYILSISSSNISIVGNGNAGAFYGMQSLIQLLPVLSPKEKLPKLTIPCLNIEDEPRFQYRGMHLDVSRHFFPVEYIKKYIDYIALHKMNTFHWHLTDDQGWRIEIKKYPKLTSIGAWRDGTIIGRFPGKGNDNTPHGGFYTQEQIKEVVQYAANRFITVIPEIEMPGHSMAVLAAYPEYSTTPDVRPKVPMTWGLNGVENNVFAPTEKTFSFLEDVLTEVMDLFPSNTIHIGGDECSKRWWKVDSFSQQLMRAKNLKNEDELQSYFIQRIEKFVNSKGRKIIGWDEILEGGLAPNALVMSWTGEKGGIHAAKEKHQVVMTPGGWCYFDHSQTKNEDSVTIGSYLPLEKVYGYDPVPKELNEEEAKYILGAQGNVWTEYMAYPSKIEYMIFPRMSALSEVLWTPKEKKNWTDFEQRLPQQIKRYGLWKANYSKAYYDLQTVIEPTEKNEGVKVSLTAKSPAPIAYQLIKLPENDQWSAYPPLDKKQIYTKPLEITNNSILQAIQDISNTTSTSTKLLLFINKATGKKISTNKQPSSNYPGNGGIFSMVNGAKSEKGINSSEWCGWVAQNVELIIDLGKETNIQEINLHILHQPASWIYAPEKFEIELSNDGIKFEDPHTSFLDFNTYTDESPMKWMKRKLSENPSKSYNTRYVKIKVSSVAKIPDGNPGAGKSAWMFIDEIEIK